MPKNLNRRHGPLTALDGDLGCTEKCLFPPLFVQANHAQGNLRPCFVSLLIF